MDYEELNDDHFETIEFYWLKMHDNANYFVEINRDEELLWIGKECLSFVDAIKLQDQIDNIDFSNTGFKPWFIPAFGLFIDKDEFTQMMEYFNINKIKL